MESWSDADTVILDELSDDASADTAFKFVHEVVKKPGTTNEVSSVSRLVRQCPDLIQRATSNMAREKLKVSRERIKVTRNLARLRDAETKYREIKSENEALRSQAGVLREYRGHYLNKAAELREQQAACVSSEEAYQKKMGAMKRKLEVADKRISNRDSKIVSLEKQLTDAVLRATAADTLAHELLRLKEEIGRYEAHAKRMVTLFGPAAATNAVVPKQEKASRSQGQAEAGPSNGASAVVGLPPYAIRSVIKAQQPEDSDEDDITVMAVKGPSAGVPVGFGRRTCSGSPPSSITVECGSDSNDEITAKRAD